MRSKQAATMSDVAREAGVALGTSTASRWAKRTA